MPSPLARRHAPRALLVAVCLLAVTLVPAAAAPAPSPPSLGDDVGTPLLGGSRLSAAEIVGWFGSTGHTPRIGVELAELVDLFLDEGAREGVRGDVAFAQSMVETGYLTFPAGGQVRPEHNNYAGIGAFDDGRPGHGYPDARTGVRAQMQLLHGYAEVLDGEGRLLNPPAHRQGAAPTWEDMGGGNWATDPGYAGKVLAVYNAMLASAGLEPDVAPPPPSPPDPTQPAEKAIPPPPPPPPPPDEAPFGYWAADAGGQVHDRGVMRFLGSAASRALTAPVVDIEAHPNGAGYWVVAADGAVFDFGDAHHHGSLEGLTQTSPVVGLAVTASGEGYWIAQADGAVTAFGDAEGTRAASFADAATGVSDIAATTGGSFSLLRADGTVLAGDGSGWSATTPVVGRAVALEPTPDGGGAWILDESGAVHALGAAPHAGDLSGQDAVSVVDLQTTTSGTGYWIASSDGGVASFGDAGTFPQPSRAARLVGITAPR
ncbi:MAG: glucosaminidase domain-containing protein [Acidimicrobiia bacterium]|nr:glucosaminidase domain-containing protein [Acidimicrobiia bacterium]